MNDPEHSTHILIIGPGPIQVGGVATFIQFIMQSTYLNKRFAIKHLDTARNVEDHATAGRFSFLNLIYFLRQIYRLWIILENSQPQVVHLSITAGWSFWKTVMFILVSRAFRAKVVAHMHGGDFNIFYEQSNSFVRKLIAWSLNKADVVVALSAWWKKFYLQINPSLNVVVISNCPEEAFLYCRNLQNLKERMGNTILFVGSLGKRKGIFNILNAIPMVVRDFRSAHFVFLGEEEVTGEKERILTICREARLLEHVTFLGYVTGAEKYWHYQHSDIFILPSHAENLPFSVLEGMAMGLPVITTPVGGIPEMVEDGRNGFLIQPGNEKELAERILLLLNNPRIREQMGECNWKKVQENYQPESISHQWEVLYRSLIGIQQTTLPKSSKK